MKRSVSAAARVRRNLVGLLLASGVPVTAALAQDPTPVNLPPLVTHAPGSDATIRGLIVARRGDEMYVRADGALHLVMLTDSTSVVAPAGFMKTDKKHYDVSVLIPGLGVTVDGPGSGNGSMLARRVKFAKEALKVARQIEAGGEVMRADIERLGFRTDSINGKVDRNAASTNDSLSALNKRLIDSVRAFNERIASLDEYGVKVSGQVNFKSGSSELSADAKRTLDQLVANATGLTGYMIQVAGYADATGPDRLNQRLTDARAEAVVDYLVQQKNIPPRRILNPTGFGEAHAIGSNATASGRAQNRRVEVKVLVNTGIRGS